MRRWVRHFGLLLGIVATAAFVFYAVRTLRGQDLSRYVSAAAIAGIAIAAMGYSLIIPLSALAWRQLLKDMEVTKRWSELGIIMSVTQLAKYIPGNVGQHIGRAAMSIRRGIPVRPYTISVVIEAVLAVVAATITGVAGCGLSGMSADILARHGITQLSTITTLACVFVLAIILARRLLPALLRQLASKRGENAARNILPRDGVLAFALSTYILNYAVLGAGFTIMVMLLLPDQHAQWLLLTGSFALAWVVGFFAPGAPAGLGVREGLMLALLQFSYARPDALLIVIALRLATTLGDIVCFLAGSAAFFLTDRRAPVHAANPSPGRDHEA
jgi:hypothetical protein